MNIWPFGNPDRKTKKRNGGAAPASAPVDPTPMSPIKWQALQHLEATLTVLRSENIPLATPVHGTPARGARFLEIPIHLDRRRVGPLAMRKVLNKATFEAIQAAASVDQVNGWQVRNSIIYQYQLERELWKYYKRSDLASPQGIGIGTGRQLVEFTLTDKNVLVGGETRSGKSVTVEGLIFSLAAQYQPLREAGLVIIDPNRTLGIRKKGLKATTIGSFTNAAHLLRPIAYSPQEIDDAINYVYREWRYHRMPNGIQDAPAIVLVIDELMNEAVIGDKESDSFNQDHLTKISQVASQGVKNNIFVIAGAQDPKIGNTSGMLMRSLTLRYVGKVTDFNASRTLTGRDGVNAHLLTERGDFVEIGQDSLRRFQVAEPTREDFDRLDRRFVRAEPVESVEALDPSRLPADSVDDEAEAELAPAPNGSSQVAPEQAVTMPNGGQAILDPSLLVPPEPDLGGNRQVEIDMRTMALYFYERSLSIAQAAEKYGIRRRVHEAHRDEALALADEIKWLRAGNPPRSPYYLEMVVKQGG